MTKQPFLLTFWLLWLVCGELRRQTGCLCSPHVASLQCDLALVHMLTAGSPAEGMICQPLFMKGRQRKPVR